MNVADELHQANELCDDLSDNITNKNLNEHAELITIPLINVADYEADDISLLAI